MADRLDLEAINIMQKIQARRFLELASYIVYIYDFLLTYSEVQRLIWPSQVGVVKVCYYFNRVIVPIGLTINTWQMSGFSGPLSGDFCKQWIPVAGYMGVISLGVSNMILLLWVHAIYGRPKKVLVILLAFFLATYATILVLTTRRILDIIEQITLIPHPLACIVNEMRPTFLSTRVVPIDTGFDVLIFCMTVYKGIEHARTVKSISTSPILSTLYRDGLGYFIVIILLKLVSFLTYFVGKTRLNLFGTGFFLGLTTALVSRMLLNLRIAIGHRGQGILDQEELTVSLRSNPTCARVV